MVTCRVAGATITANVLNNDGILAWGDFGLGVPADLVLNGNYTQGPTGDFIVGVDAIANTAGKIQVTGTANLDGFLTFSALNNNPVDVSQSFDVLQFSSVNGAFNFSSWYGSNYSFSLTTPFSFLQSATKVTLSGNVHVVSNNTDAGVGSLRQAILDANASSDPTLIGFRNIGTIQLNSPLPNVTQPIEINAAEQSGFVSQPLIELDGTGRRRSQWPQACRWKQWQHRQGFGHQSLFWRGDVH